MYLCIYLSIPSIYLPIGLHSCANAPIHLPIYDQMYPSILTFIHMDHVLTLEGDEGRLVVVLVLLVRDGLRAVIAKRAISYTSDKPP